MAFGNRKGVKIDSEIAPEELFAPGFGNIVCEVPKDKIDELTVAYAEIGEVTDEEAFVYGDMKISMDEAMDAWTGTLEKVFKTRSKADTSACLLYTSYEQRKKSICGEKSTFCGKGEGTEA